MFLGSVSEFPGEVLSVKFPSLPSGIGLLLEADLSLAGGNSSPEPIFGKLFLDDYPLKWKYIYPCLKVFLGLKFNEPVAISDFIQKNSMNW